MRTEAESHTPRRAKQGGQAGRRARRRQHGREEDMHYRGILSVIACVAALQLSSSFAQTSNTDNPNDAVADALAPPPYGEPISLEMAKKVAAAAVAETTKRNWNAFCISVVNPSGDLVYFEKQDNCQYASIGLSQHKARTAARYRRPTLVFETLLGKGAYFAYLATLDDVIASRGGNLLIVDGKIIGAVGVSGGSGAQDNVVSLAGQAALK
ncbi:MULTISPECIES: heme-binding protein [unclassified Bradyrhizobium]|uniref:GlcG/HbpS family heme-binding protein n=1 Tax=unclassified Bradyrhizobium TaxID=2631580 RepID=UPI0024E09A57|nr:MULTISPECIES: heme-binding protein [unclassified Bradyrhizobium]